MKLYRYKIYENDFKVEVQSVESVEEMDCLGNMDVNGAFLDFEKGVDTTYWLNRIVNSDYEYSIFSSLKELKDREIEIVRNMIGRTT